MGRLITLKKMGNIVEHFIYQEDERGMNPVGRGGDNLYIEEKKQRPHHEGEGVAPVRHHRNRS
jgi:hypothetical protein